MLRREHRAINLIKNLFCRRAKEHSAKAPGVGGHYDQTEWPLLGALRDTGRCIAREKESRKFRNGKLGPEKIVETITRNA